jgi:carbon-monoxide dehydrogenase medium subunit
MLYNLREYHRPTDINEALQLLRRPDIRTVALGGGIGVVGEGGPDIEAVVDLDGLGLDFIEQQNGTLRLGATVRLQTLVDELEQIAGGLLAKAVRRMGGPNIRNMATLGGALGSGRVHSPLSVSLAALQAQIEIDGQADEIPLWIDLAEQIQGQGMDGHLITAVYITLSGDRIGASYQQVGRTPADYPILCVAAVAYPSDDGGGQVCVAVGGLTRELIVISSLVEASTPRRSVEGIVAEVIPHEASGTAYISDFLGSAEYRQSVAPILVRRALVDALDQIGIQAGE